METDLLIKQSAVGILKEWTEARRQNPLVAAPPCASRPSDVIEEMAEKEHAWLVERLDGKEVASQDAGERAPGGATPMNQLANCDELMKSFLEQLTSLPFDFGAAPPALADGAAMGGEQVRAVFNEYRKECADVLNEKCRAMQALLARAIDAAESQYIFQMGHGESGMERDVEAMSDVPEFHPMAGASGHVERSMAVSPVQRSSTRHLDEGDATPEPEPTQLSQPDLNGDANSFLHEQDCMVGAVQTPRGSSADRVDALAPTATLLSEHDHNSPEAVTVPGRQQDDAHVKTETVQSGESVYAAFAEFHHGDVIDLVDSPPRKRARSSSGDS